MKQLVLAEKPSVAKEIARVLGCKQSTRHYIEGPKYVVTWALGHLVTLAEPEDYDHKYKTWQLEHLPIMPEKMNLKVMKETSHQFRAISQLAKRKDLSSLIIATDAGREGELVARWIMEMIKWRKPFQRLWISSQTDQAIKDGFANLKEGKQYNNLYESAVCRAEADWLIGLNVTRALTSKYNAQLAAGRVQTPTLAMVMQREEAIKSFKSVPYWTVEADFGSFKAIWRQTDNRLFDQAQAQRIVEKTRGKSANITQLKTTEKIQPQPLAYDLTELQRDANRKYGFSAKQTSNVLQRLYEQHKLVTYPRTDSRYLTSDMVPTLKGRLESIAVGPYAQLANPLLRKALPITKRIVDDSKVTDHHAIIPTEQYLQLAKLNNDERRLYDLIARRFIALFYPVYRYDETALTLDVAGETFYASGKVMKALGWKVVYGSNADDSDVDPDGEQSDDNHMQGQTLPKLSQGETLQVVQCEQRSHQTKPPLRFTEAQILTQMEKHNLGTPATRADIIERLLTTDTIERLGNRLAPTGKGAQLIEMVASELKSPELTAKWEIQLEHIARGKGNKNDFLMGIRQQTRRMIQEIKQSNYDYKPHNLTHSKCPDCGKNLMEVSTKRGKMLVCQDRECGHRRAAEPRLINKRCPQCRKKMELHDGKAGKYAQCRRCNVIEMLDKEGGKRNRRNNRHLIQKYSDNKELGSSLGDALKKALSEQKQDE